VPVTNTGTWPFATPVTVLSGGAVAIYRLLCHNPGSAPPG